MKPKVHMYNFYARSLTLCRECIYLDTDKFAAKRDKPLKTTQSWALVTCPDCRKAKKTYAGS